MWWLVVVPPGQFGCFAGPCGLGLEVTGFLPSGLVLARRSDRGPGLFWVDRDGRNAVVKAAGRGERPGAGVWQVDDRRIEFDRPQPQGLAGPVGEQKRVFGQILQECRFDGPFVDALSCRRVAPVGPASLGL